MSNQQEARLGQQIGEYRLVRKLGGGGFGTVYLAEHVHTRALAAIKVLDVRLARPEDFKDFLNEVRTVRLRHPHIVPLLDFGISREDLPFLVMEYAPAGTLRDRHPRGNRLPLSAIVFYVDQLASALQYAHDQRVIHRDVKPENILVRADGTLLVSDFGIAKLLEQSVIISQQAAIGTPVYMAPEQYMGYPCFASDQYALAVVIYEWICGVSPFQGPALGLAYQHVHTLPPRLRNHLPTVPEAVERVVFKALAKAPEDRFGRIEEFASALHEAVQSSPHVMAPSSSIETSNTVPLVSPPQVSQSDSGPKPEVLVRTFTDTEGTPIEPALQTVPPVGRSGSVHTSGPPRRKKARTPWQGYLSAVTPPVLARPAALVRNRSHPRGRTALLVVLVLLLLLLIGSTAALTAFFNSHQSSSVAGGSLSTGKSGQTAVPTARGQNNAMTTSGAATATAAAQNNATPTATTIATHLLGQNLIVNGDAESGGGATDGLTVVAVPGWTTIAGAFTAVAYNTIAFPQTTEPGPADRGKNFFAGGPGLGRDNGTSTATQNIDVSPIAHAVDTDTISFALSGYLGGYGEQGDEATLVLQFLGAGDKSLGQTSIGPVTASDRNSQTQLLMRSISGKVPAGTRSVTLMLIMKKFAFDYNDGYADNLSLVLQN
jgi:serine/threonine protein kinase